jgi:carboxymethylenebutenolidase
MVLIKEFHRDLQTAGGSTMRVYLFHPTIPNYPHAKFPGVVVFSEIYQGELQLNFCSSIFLLI